MARVPIIEPDGVLGAIARRLSRKRLGLVPKSLGVMWHNRRVLADMATVGRKAERWDRVGPDLKAYAHMAAAATVGCSFCLNYGYFQAHHRGVDPAKASQVPRWRESSVFAPLERDVMAYAEAVCATPPTVTDELSARLLEHLGPAALIELTAWVAFADMTSRSNIALGIEAEGLSEVCAIPLAPRAEVAVGST